MRFGMGKPGFVSSLFVVWLGHFMVDFMLGIWPVYKTMIGFDLATAGVMIGVSALCGEGLQIVWGSLADRGYSKILVLVGVGLAAMATLLPYLDSGGWCLFAAIFLAYIGSGIYHPSAGAIMARLSGRHLGLLLTLFASGGALGLAVSQIVFSQVYFATSGKTLYLAIPTIALVLYGLVWRVPVQNKEPEIDHSEHSRRGIDWKGMKRVIQNRDMRLIYGVMVCTQAICWSTIFLLPDILQNRQYPLWLCYGAGHLAFMLGGGFMSVPAGYLSDRFSERRVIMGAGTLGLLSLYTFLSLETLPVMGVLAILFVAGASFYSINGLGLAFGNRLMSSSPGLVSAFLMGLAWVVAESLAPMTSGFLASSFETAGPARALGVMGGLAVIALGCSYYLPQLEPNVSRQDISIDEFGNELVSIESTSIDGSQT